MFPNLMQEFFKIEWDGIATVIITMIYVNGSNLYIQVTDQETGDTNEILATDLLSLIVE